MNTILLEFKVLWIEVRGAPVLKSKGSNPLSYATEIVIEIKQLYPGHGYFRLKH